MKDVMYIPAPVMPRARNGPHVEEWLAFRRAVSAACAISRCDSLCAPCIDS